jgi:divalent metal cation (Fe/Co/Zn/Cd) transporter
MSKPRFTAKQALPTGQEKTRAQKHLIADDIEKVLEDKFNIQDVMVHIEPMKNDVDKA